MATMGPGCCWGACGCDSHLFDGTPPEVTESVALGASPVRLLLAVLLGVPEIGKAIGSCLHPDGIAATDPAKCTERVGRSDGLAPACWLSVAHGFRQPNWRTDCGASLRRAHGGTRPTRFVLKKRSYAFTKITVASSCRPSPFAKVRTSARMLSAEESGCSTWSRIRSAPYSSSVMPVASVMPSL